MSKTQRNQLKHYLKEIEKEIKGQEFEDFCEEFQFDKVGDKEFFNDRFNDPALKLYLFLDRTHDFFRELRNAIELASNIIIFIHGPRNEAKSTVAQDILLFWKEDWKRIQKIEVNSKHPLVDYVGFSDAEMGAIFKLLELGDMAIRDERPRQGGKGTMTDIKNLENICNITRAFQVSFCFCHPKAIEEEGVDYYLEVAGKQSVHYCNECNSEYKNFRKRAKICPNCGSKLELDYDKCFIRCIWYDRRRYIMGTVYFKLHNNNMFRKMYDIKKNANIKKTLIFGGFTPHLPGDGLEKDCIKLFEFCLKRDISTKTGIKTQLTNYNLKINPDIEPEKLIVGTNDYIEDLISNVFEGLNGNLEASLLKNYILEKREQLREQDNDGNHIEINNLVEQESNNSEIRFHNTVSFPDFCYLNIQDEKIGRIAKELASGESIRNINDSHKDLGFTYISQTSKLLRQEGYKYRLGYLFEKWNALNLGVPIEELDKYVAGTEKVPDLIWEDIIYSFKVRIDSLSNTLTFYQSKDFAPEYKEAKKRNKTYIVRLLNPKWSQDLIIKELDPVKDPEKIKFKKPIKIKRLVI